jgi:hypothetical protein
MELKQVNNQSELLIPESEVIVDVSNKSFIEANTERVNLEHLKNDCTIPVFSKDNECTLAHHQFIEATSACVKELFPEKVITEPEIRVSHTVKGRIPSAIGKPAKSLLESEKTKYFERMMFLIELPELSESINGNKLNLTVGGVRAYNQENLYSKKSIEKFKVFIGFSNQVCTNLCVSTDGYKADLRVSSVQELQQRILDLISNYDADMHLSQLANLTKHKLTEKQFAQFIGKLRLFNYLPKNEKQELTPILLNDSQLNVVARDYYRDDNFSRDKNGDISLYNLYNLLTGSVKSTYIDSFLDRSLNAFELSNHLLNSLQGTQNFSWYLN